MRILVSGSARMVQHLAGAYPDHLGHLLVPGAGNRVSAMLKTGLPWAADNGAYRGLDVVSFRRLLARVAGQPGCLFVACPDRVADAKETLRLFGQWRQEVAAAGQPIAFVGQDGAESTDVPWDNFDCWFVGGSTHWKLSSASADLAAHAKRQGKWVHMGRVNSMRRLRAAFRLGCDSVDGSSYSKWSGRALRFRPDMCLERHLCFLASLEAQDARQLLLFQEST